MAFIKNNILSLVVIALFIYMMFFGKSCNNNSTGQQKPDTVYSVRTEYLQQPTQYVPQYQPIIVESKQPVVIPSQYQLPTDTSALRSFAQEILKKFLAENHYQDSTLLKDSAGNNVGVYRNNDVVSENMIKSRAPSYTLRFPHTIQTITIEKPAPLSRQLFIGPELNGSQNTLIRDIGFGAIYKDRKDNLYKFGSGYSLTTGQPYFEVGRFWKISFHH